MKLLRKARESSEPMNAMMSPSTRSETVTQTRDLKQTSAQNVKGASPQSNQEEVEEEEALKEEEVAEEEEATLTEAEAEAIKEVARTMNRRNCFASTSTITIVKTLAQVGRNTDALGLFRRTNPSAWSGTLRRTVLSRSEGLKEERID